jgi:hypothetical protein
VNPAPFISRIPVGMKYMLATLCSNPMATKAMIGKKEEGVFRWILKKWMK